MKKLDPNLKVIAILGACFGGAIAISGNAALGALTAVAAIVAGMLATQPKKLKSDGRLIRCPDCPNWMEPDRRRCPSCEKLNRKGGL